MKNIPTAEELAIKILLKGSRISKYSYAKFYTIKEATDFINSKPTK